VIGGASRMIRQLPEQIANDRLRYANSNREWIRLRKLRRDRLRIGNANRREAEDEEKSHAKDKGAKRSGER